MKTLTAATSISVLAGAFVAASAADKIVVTNDSIRFKVLSYDDGRRKPYAVHFTHGSVRSKYKFKTVGDDSTDIRVVDIEVGSESYTAKYKRNGELKEVLLDSSDRRNLIEEGEGDESIPVSVLPVSSFACYDCGKAWDTVCGSGLETVCDLVDFGAAFSDAASASVSALCTSFGGACGSMTASTACDGQCTSCLRALEITLEWFDTGDLDLHVIEPTGSEVYFGNKRGDVGFLNHDNTYGPAQDPEKYLLYSGLDVDVDTVIGQYQAYIKVYVIRNDSIPWKMTATLNGEVAWVEEGEFMEDDDGRRLSTSSGFSATTSELVSDVFTVMLDEYIDNDCTNTALSSIAAEESGNSVKVEKDHGG